MLQRVLALTVAFLAATAALHAGDPLEGLWRVTGSGTLLRIALEPGPAGTLDILWEDGPILTIRPGTVVGHAVQTHVAGVYDCSLSLNPSNSRKRLGGKVTMVMRLDKTANAVTFEPYEQKTTVNLRGLLPWWLRRTVVKKTDTRPSGLDGARRVDDCPDYLEP